MRLATIGTALAPPQARSRGRADSGTAPPLLRPGAARRCTRRRLLGLLASTEAQAGALVTTDSAGHPTGIVSEAAVTAVPPERRPWVPVNDVARPLVPGCGRRDDTEWP